MKLAYANGVTSVILRVKITDTASSSGGGKTGLTHASSGLIISTIADKEATATAYTAAGSTIETITTLGTFATPTTNKCRFKEVDATNHPGLYEIQIANARWAVSNARSVIVTVLGASGAAQVDAEIQLEPVPAQVRTIDTDAITAAAIAGSALDEIVNQTWAHPLGGEDSGQALIDLWNRYCDGIAAPGADGGLPIVDADGAVTLPSPAPAGYGEAAGVTLVRGLIDLVVEEDSRTVRKSEKFYVGETPLLQLRVRTLNGEPIPLTGPVVGMITNAATGTVIAEDIATTEVSFTAGQVTMETPEEATDADLAGQKLNLTLSWTDGGGRLQVAGGYILEIERR